MKTLPLRTMHSWSMPSTRWMAACCLGLCLASPPTWAQDNSKPSTNGASVPSQSALDARLFYQLLLGEISMQQGDPGTAYSLMLDSARRTKNSDLFQRAIQMALQARSGDSALAAARAWAEVQPTSVDARRFELQILLATGQLVPSMVALETLLELMPAKERQEAVHAVPQTYARVPDKAQTLKALQPLLERLTRQPALASAAHTALARLHWATDAQAQAVKEMEQALTQSIDDTQAAVFALELLENGQNSAEMWLKRHLDTPAGRSNVALRTAHVRTLLDMQRRIDARTELQALTTQHPTAAEAWLLLASLDLQEKKLAAAQTNAERFLGLARDSGNERLVRAMNQAYLMLAQIAESNNDFAAANAWLDRIENNEEVLAAQIRRASLLARQGQLPQARALLRNLPERTPQDLRNKRIAEAQLLRDLKRHADAFGVFQDIVARWPEDTDLLYEAAMSAERANLLDDMERLLRRVMTLKPDHAHAYNALGYSLAERNMRLPEARQLIEKAVALAPKDAYIRDSLGWVAFREGNLAKAKEVLQSAYQQQPDAEIAAHLGEVLWTMGEKDQALKIWREGLLLANDNETLQATLRRLRVTP